ncbi:hypothetical protein BpHYR1_054231 [Brachionus plicatilis]|uniref:Uncharacterized protein n=1 Tax=Brachionus plicatilis TaxID=10195 RepID=A0A3M7SS38_BRAPC|nr:hypothetical protein BpHYR1_054231 [Brachionus plicatilis]
MGILAEKAAGINEKLRVSMCTLTIKEVENSTNVNYQFFVYTVYPCSEIRALKPEYQKTMSLNLVLGFKCIIYNQKSKQVNQPMY